MHSLYSSFWLILVLASPENNHSRFQSTKAQTVLTKGGRGNDKGDFIPSCLMQTVTDGGTMEHINKWDRKKNLHSGNTWLLSYPSSQLPLGCSHRSYFICSHEQTQFLPQTGCAVTPVQLSASHTQCLPLSKATSGVPTLKSEIPISSITLGHVHCQWLSYTSVPTANRPCWLTQVQTALLAQRVVKSELRNESFHNFLFFSLLHE